MVKSNLKLAKTKRKTKKVTLSNKIKNFLSRYDKRVYSYGITIVMFAIIGTLLLTFINASPESNCSSDGKGTNGYLYPFCKEDAGAHLPINYDLSSLKGDVKYVSINGSDSSNGSQNSPFRTLSKAISLTGSNGNIVVQKGTYREGRLSIPESKTLRIIAYPGHTPVFSGSIVANDDWINEGELRYRSYIPRPVTDGSGVDFTSGQNLTGDKIGRNPDQVWVGATQLRQVSQKSAVKDGSFWVDSATNRLYMSPSDVDKGNVEVSGDKGRFIVVNSPKTTIEGITITRFSNTASDYGVVLFHSSANEAGLRNVRVTDAAFISIMYAGNSIASNKIMKNNFAENVSIEDAGWMGFSATFTDYLTLNKVKVINSNKFDEFTTSPQSGGLKTSRTYYTKVLNSDFSNNRSHAIWFDQSNKDTEVVGNIITGNLGAGLFYEISDGLLFANNYVKSQGNNQAVRLAGSSGLKLINNTLVGGVDPVGIYVDSRSMPGCSDPSKPDCYSSSGQRLSWGGDKDTLRPLPSTMDFMPRLDLMINNILAYPTGSKYCGVSTTFCITEKNTDAVAPLETIIHKAEPGRNIPQTRIDGNVYTNGNSTIIKTPKGTYSNIATFTDAMSRAPVSISGLDANSKQGDSWVNRDGTPSTALLSANSQSVPIPNDALINKYIPANSKGYGIIPAISAIDTPPPPPTVNQPPQISISGVQASYTQPSNISITANATDLDGSIAKVEFFSGSNKLGELFGSEPYVYRWDDVQAGNYSIIAKAIDDKGASAVSAPVSTKVITAPAPPPDADTQAPSAPSNLTRSLRLDWGKGKYVMDLRWNPSTDNSGSIAKYQISRDGKVIGTSTNNVFTDKSSLSSNTNYNYSVVAYDVAGNISNPTNASVKTSCFLFWCSIK